MFRPTDALLVGFEYDRVQCSQLLNGDRKGLPVETEDQIGSGNPALEAEGLKRVLGLALDDSNQVRVGAEYYMAGLTDYRTSSRSLGITAKTIEVVDLECFKTAPRWGHSWGPTVECW